MKILKYGILIVVVIAVITVGYFRIFKKPRPYENWPIVKKHACVFGAYYFSHIFSQELDNSVVNAGCNAQVESSLALKAEPFSIGTFCGKGAASFADKQNLEQTRFLRESRDEPLSESRMKSIELVKMCIKAVTAKFDLTYKTLSNAADYKDETVAPPPK